MHHCDRMQARANLSLVALLLAVACKGSVERAFELTAPAPSFVGLTDTGACAIAITDVGAAACITSTGDYGWRAEVCRPVRQRPTIIGGSLWVACDDGAWTAVDVKTGKLRWKLTGRRAPSGPLASDGPHGFITGTDGVLEAVDETGATLWTQDAGSRLWASGETVVASHEQLGVVAFHAASGDRLWSDEKPAVAIAGTEARVITARAAGDLVARDLSDGKVLWGATLGAFAPDTLSVEGDDVMVGLLSRQVVTLAAADGSEKARATFSAALAAPVRHGAAALQGREGCAAIIGTTQTVCVDHQLRGSPVVKGGVLMLAPRDGRVLGYKLEALTRRAAP